MTTRWTGKRWEYMTTNERIASAGWYKGTEAEWWNLPTAERETLAFNATGCEVAFPTWDPKDVDCVHTGCLVRRGKLPTIAITNSIIRYEHQSGWLRFLSRTQAAQVFRAIRNEARRTGIYDPWKMPNGWRVMVSAGIQGER